MNQRGNEKCCDYKPVSRKTQFSACKTFIKIIAKIFRILLTSQIKLV